MQSFSPRKERKGSKLSEPKQTQPTDGTLPNANTKKVGRTKHSFYAPGKETFERCMESVSLGDRLDDVSMTAVAAFLNACHQSGSEIKKLHEGLKCEPLKKEGKRTSITQPKIPEVEIPSVKISFTEDEISLMNAKKAKQRHGAESTVDGIVHETVRTVIDRVVLLKEDKSLEETKTPPEMRGCDLKERLQSFRECLDSLKTMLYTDNNPVFQTSSSEKGSDAKYLHYYEMMNKEYQEMAKQYLSEEEIARLKPRVKFDYVGREDVTAIYPNVVPRTAMFFKTEPFGNKPDKFGQALEEHLNIKSYLIPTLDIKIKVVHELQKALRSPELYAGLIFSSARTVQAIKKNLECLDENTQKRVLELWGKKKNFSVYKTTAELAETELSIKSMDQEGKCMADLVTSVETCENPEGYKPYLYPCSFLSDKKHFSKSEKIQVDMINCYAPTPHPDAPKLWKQICQEIQGYPEFYVFFSPSGVEYTVKMLQEVDPDVPVNVSIAIGPTTEKKLRECGLDPVIVADTPSPDGIVNAIKKYLDPFMTKEPETAEEEKEAEEAPDADLSQLTRKQVSQLQLKDLLKGLKPEQQPREPEEQHNKNLLQELLTQHKRSTSESSTQKSVPKSISEFYYESSNGGSEPSNKEQKTGVLHEALRHLALCRDSMWRRPQLHKREEITDASDESICSVEKKRSKMSVQETTIDYSLATRSLDVLTEVQNMPKECDKTEIVSDEPAVTDVDKIEQTSVVENDPSEPVLK